ncbi:hypothetical protein SHEEN_43 [Mycobacterium phage Sheen]|uniref:Uncharacterized protein n=1 Tax=Mycobacterium phage Sheen TaxID=1589274 RepID=A0A0B5A5X3_9CAUD|nr:hypothetical protein AVV31_gp51 [Mycobacterium phage Sheen]AJD82461.1 hypothetical protein SHEEN_43 [Mycobacterium phage Sheen]
MKRIEKRTILQAHLVPLEALDDQDVTRFAMESAWEYLLDRFPDGKVVESALDVKTFAPGEWDAQEYGLDASPDQHALILTTAVVLL